MQLRLATVFSVLSFVVDDKVRTSCLWFRLSVKRTECPCNCLLRIRISRKVKMLVQPNARVGNLTLKDKTVTWMKTKWTTRSMIETVNFYVSHYPEAYFSDP